MQNRARRADGAQEGDATPLPHRRVSTPCHSGLFPLQAVLPAQSTSRLTPAHHAAPVDEECQWQGGSQCSTARAKSPYGKASAKRATPSKRSVVSGLRLLRVDRQEVDTHGGTPVDNERHTVRQTPVLGNTCGSPPN